jgi:hypothetical protein
MCCAAWWLQRLVGDPRGREAGGEISWAGRQGPGQCPALRHPASGRHKAASAHFRGEFSNLIIFRIRPLVFKFLKLFLGNAALKKIVIWSSKYFWIRLLISDLLMVFFLFRYYKNLSFQDPLILTILFLGSWFKYGTAVSLKFYFSVGGGFLRGDPHGLVRGAGGGGWRGRRWIRIPSGSNTPGSGTISPRRGTVRLTIKLGYRTGSFV